GRSRWLLAAALVACAVLAVLIFRHQETVAPWEQHEGEQSAATDAGPAMDDRDVGVLAAELMRTVEEQVEAGTGNGEQGTEVVPLVAVVAPEATVPPEAKTVPAPAPTPAPRKLQAGTVISSVTTVSAKPVPVPAPLGGAAEAAKEVAKEAPKPEAKVVAASAAPTQAAPAPVDPKVLVERMRLAERRMSQVTDYLAAKPGAAPLWNDPQAEAAARQARTQIRPRRGAKFELIEPQWRLQQDNASISAGYKVRSDGGAGQGRLDVHLVWREGLWLVRGVELAPAAGRRRCGSHSSSSACWCWRGSAGPRSRSPAPMPSRKPIPKRHCASIRTTPRRCCGSPGGNWATTRPRRRWRPPVTCSPWNRGRAMPSPCSPWLRQNAATPTPRPWRRSRCSVRPATATCARRRQRGP